jgi:hypothetical protein
LQKGIARRRWRQEVAGQIVDGDLTVIVKDTVEVQSLNPLTWRSIYARLIRAGRCSFGRCSFDRLYPCFEVLYACFGGRIQPPQKL